MVGEEEQKENKKMEGWGKEGGAGREGGASCVEKAMQQSEVQRVILRKERCATWVIC